MNWFLSLFAAYREMSALANTQAQSLENEIIAHEETKSNLEAHIISLNHERARRVSAETVASERRGEIDRLLQQNREYRESFERVTADRLKSLDTINLKLMEPRIAEPAPDLEKYKQQAYDGVVQQIVTGTRAKNRAVDAAVLAKLYPEKFGKRVIMNEKIEETAA